jgi:hypothetical protein
MILKMVSWRVLAAYICRDTPGLAAYIILVIILATILPFICVIVLASGSVFLARLKVDLRGREVSIKKMRILS